MIVPGMLSADSPLEDKGRLFRRTFQYAFDTCAHSLLNSLRLLCRLAYVSDTFNQPRKRIKATQLDGASCHTKKRTPYR